MNVGQTPPPGQNCVLPLHLIQFRHTFSDMVSQYLTRLTPLIAVMNMPLPPQYHIALAPLCPHPTIVLLPWAVQAGLRRQLPSYTGLASRSCLPIGVARILFGGVGWSIPFGEWGGVYLPFPPQPGLRGFNLTHWKAGDLFCSSSLQKKRARSPICLYLQPTMCPCWCHRLF